MRPISFWQNLEKQVDFQLKTQLSESLPHFSKLRVIKVFDGEIVTGEDEVLSMKWRAVPS
jgi:hypothetical protein